MADDSHPRWLHPLVEGRGEQRLITTAPPQPAAPKRQCAEALAVPNLAGEHLRSTVRRHRRATYSFSLSTELTRALKEVNRRENTSLFLTLLAAVTTLLHRYTGQSTLLLGALAAQRLQGGGEAPSRDLADTKVFRSDLSGNPTFREVVKRFKAVVFPSSFQPDSRLEQREALAQSWESELPFLCEMIFAPAPGAQRPLEVGDLHLTENAEAYQGAQADLGLYWRTEEDRLSGVAEYNDALIDPTTIARLVGHLHAVLEGIVASPEARILALPVLTAVERGQLLVEWNATHQVYPDEQCLQHLFETQVARTPTAVALTWKDQHLTYQELNTRANRLAHYLRKQGVEPEVLVGIYVERSPEMIVGELGTLKAGGAYVPLDPDYPSERLAFMLKDAQIGILLTQRRLVKKLPVHEAKIVCLDTDWEVIAQESGENPHSSVSPDNLAYVIYTSGSTGQPKGVQVLQRGVVNFLSSMRHCLSLTAEMTFLAATTISFDIAVLELFLPLTVGARILLISREVAKDGLQLKETLANLGTTIMQATPTTWRLLLEAGWSGSQQLTILCGGEALSWELAAQLLLKAQALWNLYGPTETTVWSTAHRVTGEPGPIPIGRPLANTELYVLDGALQPVPIGVAGELYIGGAGVARGYLNRPELTAERFLPHPFSEEPGARIYQTGDLVRYRAEGRLEFLGRRDQQVKIRGYRIELGEIESVLRLHPRVREVVVLGREDRPGEKRLVAYMVASEPLTTSSHELRHFLQERVPDYLVPAAFVWVEQLPLTPNGKINRQALPAPPETRPLGEGGFVVPRDRLEEQLTKLWEEALGIKPIGAEDNFFELGGDSLLAVRLSIQIERVVGKAVPPALLFQAPTIVQLASCLRPTGQSVHTSLLAIQPYGSKPPLFCVHGYDGYRALVQHLGPEQPFYGLVQHLPGQRIRHKQVEDLATHYLTEMQEVQPRGPYFLCGHSFGALVAFEMARQVAQQGQTVSFLALFDPPPLTGSAESPGRSAFSTRLSQQTRRFAQLLCGRQLHHVRLQLQRRLQYRLKQTACTIYHFLGYPLPTSLFTFYVEEVVYGRLYKQATHSYVPQRYAGRVMIFKTASSAEQMLADWSRVAGGVECHEAPGTHLAMLQEPYVRTLAEKLKVCLERAQAKQSVTDSLYNLFSVLLVSWQFATFSWA